MPRVRAVEDLAGSFRGLEPFAAVRDMTEMVYREFAYRAGVTDVTTSIEYVVHARQGVCQDFAHILIGLCRALDIPARYVSGYVFGSHAHPPNRGDGASHAWVEAFTPTHGWRGFDPTNNLMANDHYIKIAIGRDYRDVAPTRGTYRGAATEHMTVEVATRELD